MRIEYVGHATVAVDLDGVRLLTDPLLRNRVAHLRRATPVDMRARRGVDAVLVSHAHYDHLDLPSLEAQKLPIVLRGRRDPQAGSEVSRWSGETCDRPAGDPGPAGTTRSWPFGDREPVGCVSERSRYFAGDTDLFDGMAELAPLDVALVPIWGWGPGLGPGHLDPPGAARAVALLKPRVVVPIHWGTYFPIHLGLRGAPAFSSSRPRSSSWPPRWRRMSRSSCGRARASSWSSRDARARRATTRR
jgi:L-ascorbate metabolism protein UlaG (beta-lactamase superfamily)